MGEPFDESEETSAQTPSARVSDGARSKETSKSGKQARGKGSGTSNTLLVAAEKLAEASPTAGTVQDVLEGRVLGHYAQGLKQYLAIRLGSADEAAAGFAKLKDRVAGLGMDKLMEPPGIRARVFRLARALADEEEGSRGSTGTLLWMKPTRSSYEKGLTAIREAPRDGDRELLELRFARELDSQEIAFVLDLESSEVEQRLERARSEAKRLFDLGEDSELPRALLEAFALEKIQSETSGPKDEPMLPLGTVLEGRYQLEKHIGSGAFADVYKATDVAVPGHVVALKVLKRKSSSKRAREQALRELQLIASVFHPSIVQFKDHGYHDERFWFVMPWYQGEPLEARIDREPLTRQEARRIFVPLAKALATMHAAKLRHQDIKPDNIFLAKIEGFGDQEDVLPVLLDLGVAAQDAELLLAGTPTYFAPEVAAQFSYRQGDPFPVHAIGPATDVFSLALSLRNSLEPSTQPDVPAGAVDSFIRDRAQNLPELPQSKELRFLDKHFKRWMAHDPADRPTADELADELSVLTAPEERRERRMRVLRVVIPVATVLLMLIALGAYFLIEDARLHAEKAEAAELQREAAIEEAAQEREQLEDQIREAQENIETSQLSRTELEEQLATARGSLAVARRNVSRLRRQERELEKQVESLTTDLQAAQGQLTQANQQVASLDGQLETRNRELETERRRTSELTARVQALEGRVRSTEQARDAAQREADAATARVSGLERERDAAQAAQQRAERQTQQAQAQAERLREELDEARAEIQSLRRQLRQRPTPMTPTITPMVETPTEMTPTVMVRRR